MSTERFLSVTNVPVYIGALLQVFLIHHNTSACEKPDMRKKMWRIGIEKADSCYCDMLSYDWQGGLAERLHEGSREALRLL